MENQHMREVNPTVNMKNEPTNLSFVSNSSSDNGSSIFGNNNNSPDSFVEPLITGAEFGSINNGRWIPDPEEDKYFNSFPPGYKFKPSDEELVQYYLWNKILDLPLPPNRIRDVVLYSFNPEDVTAIYAPNGENEWYFFTPRDRKYPKGDRPKRSAGDGYWKATGADRAVLSRNSRIGYRKSLVFYKGKAPSGEKTDWIMHEYRVHDPPKRKRDGNDMKLDDWVLCRIYKKSKNSRADEQVAAVEENENPFVMEGATEENAPFLLDMPAEAEGGNNNAHLLYAPCPESSFDNLFSHTCTYFNFDNLSALDNSLPFLD